MSNDASTWYVSPVAGSSSVVGVNCARAGEATSISTAGMSTYNLRAVLFIITLEISASVGTSAGQSVGQNSTYSSVCTALRSRAEIWRAAPVERECTARYVCLRFRETLGLLLESAAGTAANPQQQFMAHNNATTSLTRWHALAGGCAFNLAIGTYYAWSVFMPALEAEFRLDAHPDVARVDDQHGPARDDYNVAGTIINRLGARTIALFGGLCFSGGFLLASFSHSLTMSVS